MMIHIHKDDTFLPDFQHALETGSHLTNWDLFKLNYETKKATIVSEFKELQAVKHLPHMTFLPHQLDATRTVMEEMNGRAILADEVGLGKTIEAGLILKEYMIRGLVKNVLLLVPASLVTQWTKELNDKFNIPITPYRKNYAWDEYPFYVTSIDLAKRANHRQALQAIDFDMVIIDEAHKLKNNKTLNYSFAQSLKKKYCLLLTATPVQNKVMEVFNLVSILKPGYLGNQQQFMKQYGKSTKDMQDVYLQKLIQKVMVRNRRKDTVLDDIKRKVHHIWLEFSLEEQAVYNQLDQSLIGASPLSKIMYLKELCSSREACYLSLEKSAHPPKVILQAIASLPHHTKALKLVELIKEIGNKKVIVFTEYRATQFYLQWLLNEHAITSLAFSGGMRRSRKDWIKQLFEHQAQVLIATEAGGEGINLQFCHHLINYDLPWNPMRLEQRIGRIHRFGQNENVHIYHFALKQTMEEQIMNLLYEKLAVFENVIGELDHILAKLNINNMEEEIQSIVAESSSRGEMEIKLDNFVSIIENTADRNRGVYDESN